MSARRLKRIQSVCALFGERAETMEHTGRYWHNGYFYVTQDGFAQVAIVSRMGGDASHMRLEAVKVMPSWGDAIGYARELTQIEQRRQQTTQTVLDLLGYSDQ